MIIQPLLGNITTAAGCLLAFYTFYTKIALLNMEATKSISNMNVSQGTHHNIETEERVCCYHLRLETVFDIYSVISMVEVEYLRK